MVSVAFTPVKGERTEWAVQKLTEVGVDRIVLMHSERSVVRWDAARAAAHLDRLNKVARQAAMQSRSLWLPEVSGVFDIAELVGAPAGVAMAAPGGPGPSLEHPFILVGPEGGWSSDELGFGFPLVGLGPSILRTETAAVTAGVLLSALRAGLVRPSEEQP
jgi:16S rRNA (uracil1498-N3)-methyltransferase